jgi:urease accessory protein
VRQKSRFQVTDSTDRVLSVFLQRGHVVRGGDVLVTKKLLDRLIKNKN